MPWKRSSLDSWKCSFQDLLFLFYVFACMYVCALCVFIACRGQKKGSDPLELDLQMAVCCCVGARTPEEQPMLLPTKPFLEPGLSALV